MYRLLYGIINKEAHKKGFKNMVLQVIAHQGNNALGLMSLATAALDLEHGASFRAEKIAQSTSFDQKPAPSHSYTGPKM